MALHGIRLLWTLPIRFYQLVISPWLPPTCIYSPSCSSYARQAIVRHGVLRGTAAAVLRLTRCVGGLYHGGSDPVPAEIHWPELFREYKQRWRFRGQHDHEHGDDNPDHDHDSPG